jgi:hypothetical protein
MPCVASESVQNGFRQVVDIFSRGNAGAVFLTPRLVMWLFGRLNANVSQTLTASSVGFMSAA